MNTYLESLMMSEMEKRKLWQKELDTLPEGSLYCSFRNGKPYFYRALDGTRVGITGDNDLVYKLARKKYLGKMMAEQGRVIRNMARNRIKGKRTASPVDKLIDYYISMNMDIARITCTEEHYRWMKSPYRKNPYNRQELTFTTYSGVDVRSKSEQAIGNILETRGIPYRSEQEMIVPVGWMNGLVTTDDGFNKSFYPDFIIKTTVGMIIIWEHFGMVDDGRYRFHSMEKIAAYRQGKGFHDRQLIMTFENDMRDIGSIEEIIQQRIMPFM